MTDLNEMQAGARLSRRNALKAAAAAGVGVVALAGPQVGVLGSAPAYAVGASQSDSQTVFGSVNCGGSGCNGNIRLNQGGGNAVLTVGNITVTLANLNNGCSSNPLPITYFDNNLNAPVSAAAAGVSCTASLTLSTSTTSISLPANVPKAPGNGGNCSATWSLVFFCQGTD